MQATHILGYFTTTPINTCRSHVIEVMCSNYGILSASLNYVTTVVTVMSFEALFVMGRFGCDGVGTVRA